MDPNEGDIRDAIVVMCIMEKRSTCLLPQPERTPEITYVGNEQEVWLGEMEGGMKVQCNTLTHVCLAHLQFLIGKSPTHCLTIQ